LWKNLEEVEFDVAEFDKLFSKAPAKAKLPTSKSSDIKKVKVVSDTVFVHFCLWFGGLVA